MICGEIKENFQQLWLKEVPYLELLHVNLVIITGRMTNTNSLIHNIQLYKLHFYFTIFAQ